MVLVHGVAPFLFFSRKAVSASPGSPKVAFIGLAAHNTPDKVPKIVRFTLFDASRRGEKMLNPSRDNGMIKACTVVLGEGRRARYVTPDLSC